MGQAEEVVKNGTAEAGWDIGMRYVYRHIAEEGDVCSGKLDWLKIQ